MPARKKTPPRKKKRPAVPRYIPITVQIRAIIKERALTHEDLAKLTGLHRQTITRALNTRTGMSITVADKLMRALRMEICPRS
jgi:DNA-binding XRE family transcriptional regulator